MDIMNMIVISAVMLVITFGVSTATAIFVDSFLYHKRKMRKENITFSDVENIVNEVIVRRDRLCHGFVDIEGKENPIEIIPKMEVERSFVSEELEEYLSKFVKNRTLNQVDKIMIQNFYWIFRASVYHYGYDFNYFVKHVVRNDGRRFIEHEGKQYFSIYEVMFEQPYNGKRAIDKVAMVFGPNSEDVMAICKKGVEILSKGIIGEVVSNGR